MLVTLTCACASVTATRSGLADFQHIPDYDERHHFFLFGIFGEAQVNVKEVCQDRPAKQMQAYFSASDLAIGLLSCGLWVSRTARVWCARDEDIIQ